MTFKNWITADKKSPQKKNSQGNEKIQRRR